MTKSEGWIYRKLASCPHSGAGGPQSGTSTARSRLYRFITVWKGCACAHACILTFKGQPIPNVVYLETITVAIRRRNDINADRDED